MSEIYQEIFKAFGNFDFDTKFSFQYKYLYTNYMDSLCAGKLMKKGTHEVLFHEIESSVLLQRLWQYL